MTTLVEHPGITHEKIIFGHVSSSIDWLQTEKDRILRSLDSILTTLQDERTVTLPTASFCDVSPSLPYSVRVENGKANEEIVKSILKCYNGIGVEDVDKYVDMYDKIDFNIVGDFGRLTVQFKTRNVQSNSQLRDLGIEYCRVKYADTSTRNFIKGLSTHVGRDRHSVADVYLSIDPVNRVLHWMPTFLIEEGARTIHEPYGIIVEQVPTTFHSPTGRLIIRPQWFIASQDKDGNVIQRDNRSLTIANPDIGEVRYFRPHKQSEGIFKAMFYMNDRFTGKYTFVLPR